MANPFVGEIMIVPWDFAPKGWAMCDGRILPEVQFRDLFAAIGYTFGGGGANFNLPDLRDRIPTHRGPTMAIASKGGTNFVSLTADQMPTHAHTVTADDAPAADNAPTPTSRLAASQPGNLYGSANNLAPMNEMALPASGGGTPHDNRQPYLTLNFVIALQGVLPPRDEEKG